MSRFSLRTRLALGYTAFFGAVLVLLGIGVVLTVRSELRAEMVRELQSSTDLIQRDFNTAGIKLDDYFNNPSFLERTRPLSVEGLETPSLYVQAANMAGRVVVTSASLKQQQLPLDPALRSAVFAGREQAVETMLGDAPVLMLASPLRDDITVVGVLLVAQPLREINRTIQLLSISLVLISLIALLAALRGGAWLAERALVPVGQVAATARQIVRAEDLGQRVPAAQGSDELVQLTATVNEMLERLDVLFSSQRRFVADVSHELRTPLTAMRGNLELLRRTSQHAPAEIGPSLAAMEREVNRLVRMSSDLLLLAQAESGVQLRSEPVSLDELVLEVVRDLAPLAQGLTLRPAIAEQVEVMGDRDRLKQALLNMAANALQHTPPGGNVTLAVARVGDHAELEVHDTGVGIDSEALPYVFERFSAPTGRARGRRAARAWAWQSSSGWQKRMAAA